MKKYYNRTILLSAMGMLLLASCSKNETKVYLTGGSAPVLTSTATDSISLPVTDTTATAVTFSWTNPNYQFSDGGSSLNVTYYLQFDTLSNFADSNSIAPTSISSALSTTYTVAQFNGILTNKVQLNTGIARTIYVRLEAFLTPFTSATASIAPQYSSTLSFQVTPYATPPAVAPPASDTLYITGGATNDGWQVSGNPASVAGQGMTRVSPTLYKITLPLIGGQQFLLVPVAGDWSNKYATTSSSSATTGGTFQLNAANNFNGPTASGTYTVTFNFQTGNYTITQ
jgi:hypothetical protein